MGFYETHYRQIWWAGMLTFLGVFWGTFGVAARVVLS